VAEPGRLNLTMTAINGRPEVGWNLGGLAALPGLEAVAEQLERWVAVLRAEQARRRSGAAVGRPSWKNLIFADGPGSGKSRAARAIGHIYMDLGDPGNRALG
jgi:hypothetical protein